MKKAVIVAFLILTSFFLGAKQNPIGFSAAGFYEFTKGSLNDYYGNSFGPLVGLKIRGTSGFLGKLSIEGFYGFSSDTYNQKLTLPGEDNSKEFEFKFQKALFDFNLGYSMLFKGGRLKLLVGCVNLRTKEKYKGQKNVDDKWGLSVGCEYVFEFGQNRDMGFFLGAKYHSFTVKDNEPDLSNLKCYLGISIFVNPFKSKYL